ncbi:protein unc-50 homolog A-like [Uloborus diversus]|uniref:protein unc-50 homolog A-like n=1 Tax=Uloborus diversus TaxID=327109 RepID=UPI00240A0AFF|nr:protein unc-50 homolog A-like [Uloborus diversus]XP_054717904.1 protein unc-50 homolog A-like [Uloborus diversus]
MNNSFDRSYSFNSSRSGGSSPLPSPVPAYHGNATALAKRSKFLRRLVYFKHMDFEFALWQMLSLFVSPQKVYRNFQYRKQTKNQFARDDPAFLVLLGFCLVVSSIGFAVVLRLSFLSFLKFLLWIIFIDCIAVGILICTFFWFVCSRYLKKPQCRDQDVEWAYAFDVHLNAFFPLLIILHIFQLFFYHLLISHTFISIVVGNTFWLIALGYYFYITFLGYSALHILENTQVLLYPLPIVGLLYIIFFIVGYNVSLDVMNFYQYRVL